MAAQDNSTAALGDSGWSSLLCNCAPARPDRRRCAASRSACGGAQIDRADAADDDHRHAVAPGVVDAMAGMHDADIAVDDTPIGLPVTRA